MDSLLASGDVDELRLALQGMLQPQPPAGKNADEAAVEEAPVHELAIDSSTSGAAAAEASINSSTLGDVAADAAIFETFQSCGLTLRAQLVMGGASVWPAALALAQWLLDHPESSAGVSVLELGAGAGAPGLIAAALGARLVLLTDGDTDLLPLMRDNAALNDNLRLGGAGVATPSPGVGPPLYSPRSVLCTCLDWRDTDQVALANRTAAGGPLSAGSDHTAGGGFSAGLGRAAADFTFDPLGSGFANAVSSDSAPSSAGACGAFDLVLAADVLFGVGDIDPLVRAATALLRRPASQPVSSPPVSAAPSLEGNSAAAEGARCCGGPPPRVLVARSNFFEGLVPTLAAAFELHGLFLEATAPSRDGEAAVLEFRWQEDGSRRRRARAGSAGAALAEEGLLGSFSVEPR